jgi:hypothetical protein
MLQWKRNELSYSGCVFVALVIQRAKRKSRIILSSAACLAAQLRFGTYLRYMFRPMRFILRLKKLRKNTTQAMYYNITLRRVRLSLLPCKSNKRYLLVCLCVHALRCLWVPGRVGVCMRVGACSLAFPASNAYAPYCDVLNIPSAS